MFAAILWGWEITYSEACGTRGLRVCLDLPITIWVTPGNGLAKLELRGFSVLQQHFQGLQMVFDFSTPALLNTCE